MGCRRQFVRRELLDNEETVRPVLVETADDIITIRPGVRKILIFPLATDLPFRVAIAGYVQPVASPPFTVLRRRQQPLDDLGEPLRRFVLYEGFHLLRRWR